MWFPIHTASTLVSLVKMGGGGGGGLFLMTGTPDRRTQSRGPPWDQGCHARIPVGVQRERSISWIGKSRVRP